MTKALKEAEKTFDQARKQFLRLSDRTIKASVRDQGRQRTQQTAGSTDQDQD
jgi:hypothetical protein